MVAHMVFQYDTYHPFVALLPSDVATQMPLVRCCAVCGPPDEDDEDDEQDKPLLKCSRCKAVTYCGRHHQQEHFEDHKKVCRHVQKTGKKMNALEQQLPPQMLTQHVGRLWLQLVARPFMHAKRDYMLALTVTRSYEGVRLALDQGLDCLRLCRVDFLGIRDAVPALMLQIGQIQECYDFIKWWATEKRDLNDLSVPVYTIKDAPIQEKIPSVFYRSSSVFHWAALAYIKIVSSSELSRVHKLEQKADTEAPGFLDAMMSLLGLEPLPLLEKTIAQIQSDAVTAMLVVKELNEHYWPSVMDPHSLSGDVSPGYFIHGDRFEVQNWLVPHGLLWGQDAFVKDFTTKCLDAVPSD